MKYDYIPPHSSEIKYLTKGTKLKIFDGSKFMTVTIKDVIHTRNGYEFIINKKKNSYFLASNYMENNSWVKHAYRIIE